MELHQVFFRSFENLIGMVTQIFVTEGEFFEMKT